MIYLLDGLKQNLMHTALKINLGYRNAHEAIRFLVDVLGFEKLAVYNGPTENIIAHAELQWPEGGSVTLHTSEPDKNSVFSLAQRATQDGGYPAYSVHLDTVDPKVVYDRVNNAGAKVVREMRETPLGTGFIVADPEGLYWSIGTPLPKLVRDNEGKWVPER